MFYVRLVIAIEAQNSESFREPIPYYPPMDSKVAVYFRLTAMRRAVLIYMVHSQDVDVHDTTPGASPAIVVYHQRFFAFRATPSQLFPFGG